MEEIANILISSLMTRLKVVVPWNGLSKSGLGCGVLRLDVLPDWTPKMPIVKRQMKFGHASEFELRMPESFHRLQSDGTFDVCSVQHTYSDARSSHWST